jgi:phospholipid/cholesterol/gamma-HCH transport system substrate-binding protein
MTTTVRKDRESHRVPNWAIGLGLMIVLVAASYMAFAKQLPWSHKFTIKAVFSSAQSLRTSSPVRIAGVNIGKVVDVEPLAGADADQATAQASGAPAAATSASGPTGQQAAVVTMELDDEALPLHEDSTFKLRPRLFLEGNYFVDLHPGSPNAPVIDDGHTFPINQTSYSVQLDQVLTTLQGDVRSDLQIFLNQFGNALTKYHGAEGLQDLYRSSPAAFRYTSEVNESVLGKEPGDLEGVIHGLDRVVNGLGRNEQTLQDLVTNFATFTGSFAAQDKALGEAIDVFPDVLRSAEPAYASLNSSFPQLRAFAREALPGVRSTPATLDASIPFVNQVRALVSRDELRGLVADLRPTIPELAKLSDRSVDFFGATRALSSCFNEVVIPWSEDTVKPVDPANAYPFDPVGRVFEETAYGLEGIAGESRSGDADGQYVRVSAGGGTNTVTIPNGVPSQSGAGLEDTVGLTPFPILGSMPKITDSAKTPFKPNSPCERQEPPNLQGGVGAAPTQGTAAAPNPAQVLASATPKEIKTAAAAYGLSSEQLAPLLNLAGGG